MTLYDSEKTRNPTHNPQTSMFRTLTTFALIGLVIGCLGWFLQSSAKTTDTSLRSNTLATTPVAHKSTWQIVDAEIQNVAVGQRVPAANPEMSISGENEWQNIDPRFYRVITVHVDRADGSKTEIKLLRSLDWIKDAVRLLNGEYSVTSLTNLTGKEIELVIPELDIETNAKILTVQPCPLIPDGPGEVVTATFKTNRAHVLDLVFEPTRGPPSVGEDVTEQTENVAIESLGETIELGVTPEHQIWSIDRAQFIPAGELSLNEHCITIDEKVYQLKSKTEQQNPVPVYNFEVSNQHVYYVSSEGLLVHNARYKNGKQTKSQKRSGQTKKKSVRKSNLNSNDAVSNFGVYEVFVKGVLYKVGKADLNRITKSTKKPTRLHQQLRKLKKEHGKKDVTGKVVIKLGRTTTAKAKMAEVERIRKRVKELGYIPVGNSKSYKP